MYVDAGIAESLECCDICGEKLSVRPAGLGLVDFDDYLFEIVGEFFCWVQWSRSICTCWYTVAVIGAQVVGGSNPLTPILRFHSTDFPLGLLRPRAT